VGAGVIVGDDAGVGDGVATGIVVSELAPLSEPLILEVQAVAVKTEHINKMKLKLRLNPNLAPVYRICSLSK
jgi:hypothetical protein